MRNVLSNFRKIVLAATFAASASLTLSLSTGLAHAQATGGDVVGTVKDPSGAIVQNASIVIKNDATGVSSTATSGQSGEYRISNLLPGSYSATFTTPSFAPYRLKGLSITNGKTSTVDVILAIANATSVEVEANAGVTLDTTSTNLTTTLGTQELSILPTASVGFGVLNASLLAPNVSSPGGAGIGTGPSVGGQRPRNNNYTVEGIDDNDKSVTGPLITVPNDAVSDFTLITSQFSPEFGHSSGGQFNTNIISGTNHLHGKAYEYFDNRNLNAANGTAGGKTPNSRYDYNRYGGQVGGPILRDKLFYFGNFERTTLGQSANYFLCTPTDKGLATLKSLTSYGFRAQNLTTYTGLTPTATVITAGQADPQQVDASIDQACGDQQTGLQTLSVSNLAGTATTDIPLGNAHFTPPSFANTYQTTVSADYTPATKDNFRFRYSYFTSASKDLTASLPVFQGLLPLHEHLGAFSWFHNFTPNLINEARVGYNRLYQNFPVTGPGFPGLDAFPNLIFFDANIDIGPDDNAPQSSIQNLYQFTDNVTFTKGRHTVKVGFDGRKYISPQNFVQRQRGDYEWDFVDEYLHDFAPSEFGERSAGASNYAGDQLATYAYANDTWRVTPTLTLNYGIRYEFTSVPSGERKQALNNLASTPGLITFNAPKPQYTNFAPRVGVAYAPDGKTSIRAGFGLSYDVLFDNLGLLTSPPQLSQTNDVGTTGNPGFLDPGFLAAGGLSSALVPITSPAIARAKTAAYLPDQAIPYAVNYNLTIQRVFAKNYTAEIQYLGTHGVHLAVQNQTNIQPRVNAANQLQTFTTLPIQTNAAGGKYAVFAGAINTLAGIRPNTPAGATGNIVPAFLAAGYTSKITSYAPFGGSNYNGLGLNLSRRFINGFQLNASYTFSKALDDSTAEVNASDLTQRRPLDSRNQHQEYARSALDRTQRLTIEAVYDVPYFRHRSFLLKNLAGNWQLSPIYTYETPEYVTPASQINSNLNGDSGTVSRTVFNPNGVKGTGSSIVPVFNTATPSTSCVSAMDTFSTSAGSIANCYPFIVGWQAINPTAQYTRAGLGILPNAQRNTLAGRPIDNLSMAAGKRINLTERYSFEFQAQAFNVFNHAQYVPGDIDGIASTSTAGAAANYLTPGNQIFNNPTKQYTAHARSLQLAAKFNF